MQNSAVLVLGIAYCDLAIDERNLNTAV